jgi:phage portal protein BeeE
VRGQDIGKLPLILYQRMPDGGRRRAVDHPLYNLVGRRPNDRQTSMQFREMLQAAWICAAMPYARIIRDARQRPVELDSAAQ